MKPDYKKILIPGLAAVIGGVAVFAALRPTSFSKAKAKAEAQAELQTEPKAHTPRPHKVNKLHDIWEEMDRDFKEQAQAIQARFGEASQDISQREDDKFVYLDIKVEDPKSTALNTEVTEGHIIISGTLERKSSGDEGESVYKSSFTRSLPLPDNVDPEKMETLSEAGKIVLKFPKLKA